jgi:hypothetical protein
MNSFKAQLEYIQISAVEIYFQLILTLEIYLYKNILQIDVSLCR